MGGLFRRIRPAKPDSTLYWFLEYCFGASFYLGSVSRNVIPVAVLRVSSATHRRADRRRRSSRWHPTGSCAGWSRYRTFGTDGRSPDRPCAGVHGSAPCRSRRPLRPASSGAGSRRRIPSFTQAFLRNRGPQPAAPASPRGTDRTTRPRNRSARKAFAGCATTFPCPLCRAD